MTRFRFLPELTAVALLAGVALAPAAAQVCPWGAQVMYYQQQQRTPGSRQAMLQQQNQQMMQARIQQHYQQQQQQVFLQQQHQARIQQQRQARVQQQQMLQQQRQARIVQQQQARVVRAELQLQMRIVQRQPTHPALVHAGPVPHPLAVPRLVMDYRIILKQQEARRLQEMKLSQREGLFLLKLTAAVRKQTLRLEESWRLARPVPSNAVNRRAQVNLTQRQQTVVRIKETPPRNQTRTFFKVTLTCKGCHSRCVPPTPGLIARAPTPQLPGGLIRPVPGWPTALQQPGAPALPKGLPGPPPLPVGIPMAGLPGPPLPGAIARPGWPGLPVGILNPGPSPLPLGPVALGGSPPLSGDPLGLPQAISQHASPRKSARVKKPASPDLPAGLAKPGSGPELTDPDLLQLLPVDKGGLQPAVAAVSPGARLTQALTLRSRRAPWLAVPPAPPLPETVLRLPDVPEVEAFAEGGPGMDLRPGENHSPSLPDSVLPAQPLAQLPGLALPPL